MHIAWFSNPYDRARLNKGKEKKLNKENITIDSKHLNDRTFPRYVMYFAA